ncbi:unnamed protein product [Trichogramma brassicae]|uniref:Uncharacterized protein n=1 Tax=Trichogramma brassicae TaxID=86971 RepID=A0A6H5I5M9_9HYME|nr:unnamed protein product [Trichogramma brassicae]
MVNNLRLRCGGERREACPLDGAGRVTHARQTLLVWYLFFIYKSVKGLLFASATRTSDKKSYARARAREKEIRASSLGSGQQQKAVLCSWRGSQSQRAAQTDACALYRGHTIEYFTWSTFSTLLNRVYGPIRPGRRGNWCLCRIKLLVGLQTDKLSVGPMRQRWLMLLG